MFIISQSKQYYTEKRVVLSLKEFCIVYSLLLQSEDAGNYMCVATNDAGVVDRTVTLTLQSKSLCIYMCVCKNKKWKSRLRLFHHRILPKMFQ